MTAPPAGPATDPPASRRHRRQTRRALAVVHHTDGPKVRYGVVWFVAVTAAAVAPQPLLAVVLAGAAGLAGDEVARLRWGWTATPTGAGPMAGLAAFVADPRRLPIALGAASLPLAAAAGPSRLVAALPAVVLMLLVYRLAAPRPAAGLDDTALTIAAALALGLGAAGPVLARDLGPSVAVLLVVLVAVYDASDFLIGTGSPTAWEGPAAGVVAVAVFAFAASVVPVDPLSAGGALSLGAVVAVTAPFGPAAASLFVGDGQRPARFLRRVDSLLLVGPLMAFVAVSILSR